MNKKRMRTLAIIFFICMVTFYPLIVKKQHHIQGIAASNQGNLAVAVRSVHSGGTVYLYIYSENNKLQKTVLLLNFRGGIDAIREEDDFISIYYGTSRYIYDYNGEYLIKESYDAEIPQSLFECSSGDDKYVYSQNSMGFEKVTKYTADGKSKAVFGGTFLYFKKLLWSFVPTAFLIAIAYKIIYPDAVWDYSSEDLQEIDAKLHEWWKERKNCKK